MMWEEEGCWISQCAARPTLLLICWKALLNESKVFIKGRLVTCEHTIVHNERGGTQLDRAEGCLEIMSSKTIQCLILFGVEKELPRVYICVNTETKQGGD